MKKTTSILSFFTLFALVPVFLALHQNVPTRFPYQNAVLLLSVCIFGILLGQFWLSRLLPRGLTKMKRSGLLRWHKTLGYLACATIFIHPVAMIGRRFWVLESNPIDNLLLMLRSPALLPAIVAWIVLMLIVLLSLIRKALPAKGWRTLHGIFSVIFVVFATWHVVETGRHSNPTMSVFWICLATAGIIGLITVYISARSVPHVQIEKGIQS